MADAKRLWQQKGGDLAGGDKTQVFHTAEELFNSDYARQHPFTDAQKEAMRSAEGFFDPRTGQTILLAGNVTLRPGETPQAALTRVMLHERVGHDGLNALLRPQGSGAADSPPTRAQEQWANLMKGMPPKLVAELDAIAAEPAYAHLKGNKEALALEWFARQAEARPELLNQPSMVKAMWDTFKAQVVELMARLGLDPLKGADLDTQVKSLLQRARQSAANGGSGPDAGNGALGQDLQFSMGGNGNGLPLGAEGNTVSGGDPAATPPSPGSAVPPGPLLSVEQSKQLITNVTALAAQGPLTPRQQADLDQAKKVVAQDTVNRLQGQTATLSEAQKQELAEAQGVLGQADDASSQGTTAANPNSSPSSNSAGAQTGYPPIDHGHIIGGDTGGHGRVTGGHSLLRGDGEIVAGTETGPNAEGVYRAQVKIRHPVTGVWTIKTNASGQPITNTMFPKKWSALRIETKVSAAFNSPGRVIHNGKWSAVTPSGVRVTGYINTNRVTAYPVY